MPRLVSERLLAEVALDVDTLRDDLMTHLRGRISEIEKELAVSQWSLGLFEGWKLSDMLRMAQMIADMDKGGPPLTLEQMRGKNYPYRLGDLERWRTEIDGLEDFSGRHGLFAAFARIENQIEPCYDVVYELALQVDRMVQEEIDFIRGK
jgi:hypothetical protein